MRRARRRDVYWSTWAPVERGASGSATYSARRSATAASLARALCAEAHKPWPNAAGGRYSAATTWPQTQPLVIAIPIELPARMPG